MKRKNRPLSSAMPSSSSVKMLPSIGSERSSSRSASPSSDARNSRSPSSPAIDNRPSNSPHVVSPVISPVLSVMTVPSRRLMRAELVRVSFKLPLSRGVLSTSVSGVSGGMDRLGRLGMSGRPTVLCPLLLLDSPIGTNCPSHAKSRGLVDGTCWITNAPWASPK
ncbi:hypothetical protein CA13_39250 [Planctomycetes bacterium CA13]|uniref:Uncharacterized protein n=1 Tax=Novipirellula herctigrandis TaxID=2527986 RepID=A0A5C5Z559_9BACT|nr:hypothetical protein CA13_39250 [Planctomycetes bacterium CA13]